MCSQMHLYIAAEVDNVKEFNRIKTKNKQLLV